MKYVKFFLLILIGTCIYAKCRNGSSNPANMPTGPLAPRQIAIVTLPAEGGTSPFLNIDLRNGPCSDVFNNPGWTFTYNITYMDNNGVMQNFSPSPPPINNISLSTNTSGNNINPFNLMLLYPAGGSFWIEGMLSYNGCTECCGATFLNTNGVGNVGCFSSLATNNIEQGKPRISYMSKQLNEPNPGTNDYTLYYNDFACFCNCN